MRRMLLLAAILTVAVSAAQEAPKVFAKDQRLKASITMRVKIASLADFAAALQASTKVPFSVAADIADRKITAIFRDRLGSDVLSAVQDALFLQWKKVGDGYRLILPSATDREEQEIIRTESDARRSGLVEAMKRLAARDDISQNEIDRRTKDLRAQMVQLRQTTGPETQQKIADLMEQIQDISNYAGVAICKALSNDLNGAVDSLLSGKTLCASTLALPSVAKLPSGFMDHVLVRNPDATGALVMIRYGYGNERIIGRTLVAGSGKRPGNSFTVFSIRANLNTPDVRMSKLLVRLDKWSKQADPRVMSKTLTAPGPPEASPGYFEMRGATGFTLAEHLEAIADRADVPVIGDAFRIFCSDAQYRPEKTVGAYMDGLKTSHHMRNSLSTPPIGYYCTKNGWLFARHESYWRRWAREIPESVLKPMEDAAQQNEFPSTDDYARLVTSLTSGEVAILRDDALNSALRFDPFPIQPTLGSLRLWATLSPDQVAATQGDGLKLTLLSPSQAKVMFENWIEKMWQGKLPIDLWSAFFSARGLFEVNPILRYRLHDQEGMPTQPGVVPRPARQQVDFLYDLSTGLQMRDAYVIEKAHS